MTEPMVKSKVLPTYLVVDTSSSMKPQEQLLNDTVDHVFDVLGNSPRVSEFAHISIVTFNTDTHVVLAMADIDQVSQLPMIRCGGSTNYGRMFQVVKQRIDADIDDLRNLGRAVLRPAVFILTDGAPMDKNWAGDFSALTDKGFRRRPHIISYGFGNANAAVLGKIATKAAYLATEVDNEKEAIVSMLTSLLNTLVTSANSQELRIPDQVDGYTRVPIEYVD
ncbi:VWA domain-containing protein [Micromonospora sp. NPDC006766]|uniref:vWA domain-containing protein n=1 Tax=Micromonospora sp. NPDC006766 TaxID=3154778 RepID=UPI0033CA5560